MLSAAALAASALLCPAAELAVAVKNDSRPTLCAETDNITLTFSSPEVRRFRIEARHPAYLGLLRIDRTAPDWTRCEEISRLPLHDFPPERRTVFETVEWQLVGHVFPGFWRPNLIPLKIGGRVERGFHLLQLWRLHEQRAEEVLVLYPSDGYWRARPLPPDHLRWTAYGSSFLVGPVEFRERPFVAIEEVVFDPESVSFRLGFAGGASARVGVAELDRERLALDVALDPPIGDKPFAALRSMFVTEINADVARVMWRAPGAPGWSGAPILEWPGGSAVELWAGRTLPSRHNTSAPDMTFGPFGE